MSFGGGIVLDVGTGATGTPRPLRPVLRGRDGELTMLLDRVLPPQRAGVVVVDAASGLGRTRLIDEVAAMAAATGVRVGAGRASPGDDSCDLALLLAAVFGGPAPLVDPALLRSLPSQPEQRYWLVHELASLLAAAARVAPVLVCLDDLQWADRATLAALRMLPEQLGQSPIGWLVTRCVGPARAAVVATVDWLRQHGGARVALGPLGGPDVAAIVADIVRAEPSPALLELVAGARGVPGLVVDLVGGLLEEELVVVVADRAELVAPRLPRRLHDGVRRTLDGMSPAASRVAGVAAVLGPGVAVDDLASVLGQRPRALFEPVDELVLAGVLTGDGDGLAFRSELVHRAVAGGVPASVRRLLHREADLLRARRAPTGDGTASVIRATPGCGDAVAAPRRADGDGGPDHRTRARHLAAQACDLAGAGRSGEAAVAVGDAASAVSVSGDWEAAFVLDLARSQLSYIDGAYDRALRRLTAAADDRDAIADGERAAAAAMWHSELLAVTDRLDDAITMAADGAARASRGRAPWATPAWRALHGRHLLRAGRLTEASQVLREATGPLSAAPATALGSAALVASGRVALHTVDYATARSCARAAAMPGPCVPEARRQAAWLLALQAMATGDARDARRHLTPPGAADDRVALPYLMIDPADAPHVMRLALATGDQHLTRNAMTGADRRRRLNPGVRTIAAAAAHTRGLWRSDVGELALAATLLADGGRPLPRASALEDLGRELVRRGHSDGGARALGSALELYAGAGAAWDAGRVRRRLRALGVRRRLVRAPGPTRDWAGLTAAELAVVRLVVQGLTNRAVAACLFVSPHTVSTHLRHVFAKLGVGSRVELTRIVLARDGGMDARSAPVRGLVR